MATRSSPCLDAAASELPAGAKALGIEISSQQVERFALYCDALLKANRNFNLTSIDEPRDVMRRHVLDSLSVLTALPGWIERPLSVLDVGTGGGLPGIALAIVCPQWRVVLLDSVAKKTRFLVRVIETLGLGNARVVCSRAEALGRTVARDSFDVSISRAVAATPVLIEYCAPLVHVSGSIALYRSGSQSVDLANSRVALKELRCRVASVTDIPYALGVGSERYILLIEKVSPTPERYPRRVGVARARPL